MKQSPTVQMKHSTSAAAAAAEHNMKAYLFLWNPKKDPGSFKNYQTVLKDVKRGRSYKTTWVCRSKQPQPGDVAYLQRTGKKDNGIFAKGTVTRSRYQRSDGVNAVNLEIDSLLPLGFEISRREVHATAKHGKVWMPMASGDVLPVPIHRAVDAIWRTRTRRDSLKSSGDTRHAIPECLFGIEGKARRRLVVHLRREQALRELKIAETLRSKGSLACEVTGCGFDFRKTYGKLGDGYAQVHHLKPLSYSGGETITGLSDLAVVCANCHAMIHRGGACRPPDILIPKRADE